MSSMLYEPEEFGVEIVSQRGGYKDYIFNITLLIFFEGRYWTASDSGASYPNPFTGFTPMDFLGGWRGEDIHKQPSNYREAIQVHHEKQKRKKNKKVHTRKSKSQR